MPDIEQFFRALSPDPEQVIEVPKILPYDVPMRAAVRDSQLAEQLVEVPTIISFSSLQRTMFLLVEGEFLVFNVFPLERVLQRCILPRNAFLSGLWSRSLMFSVEAFKIFAQVRVHPLLRTYQLVFMRTQMSLVKVFFFFALFPKIKRSAASAAVPTPSVPASVSSWTRVAYEDLDSADEPATQ